MSNNQYFVANGNKHEVSNTVQDVYDIGEELDMSKETSKVSLFIGLPIDSFSSHLWFCFALVSSYVHANILKEMLYWVTQVVHIM